MRIARSGALLAASALLLAGCASSVAGARPSRIAEQGPLSTQIGGWASHSGPLPQSSSTVALAALPGVGPGTLARVPRNARQVVLVIGVGRNSSVAKVMYLRYEDTAGWVPGAPTWQARNAPHGWTADRRTGELRSPIGVFALTDAAGRPAYWGRGPGAHHALVGSTLGGACLSDAFDDVTAVSRRGTRHPGRSHGGRVRPHADRLDRVDRTDRTDRTDTVKAADRPAGCVSLSQAAMKTLLRVLAAAQHPVAIMGDAADLAR
jgi:hypothetical protein